MKSTIKFGLLTGTAITALLAGASISHGQLPVSRQVANIPVALAGTGAVTPVGVPVNQAPIARRMVASVASPTITFATPGTALGALTPDTHIVLIKTSAGYGTGLPITANTTDTVTVSGTIPASLAATDEVEIVPLPTLASVFGSPTSAQPLDLASAPTAPTADKVIIDGVSYFYRLGAGNGGAAWRLESNPTEAFPAQNNTVIPNLRGVAIKRIGAATTVSIKGVVREGRAVLPIPTGTTPLSWPFPQEVSLLGSKLHDSIVKAPTAPTADKVIVNGVSYFYRLGAGNGGPGWRLESNATEALPAQNNTILNPGGKAFVLKRATATTSHPAEEAYTP